MSAEELAKLRFDGGMDAVATAMSHVQGSMSTLFNLDMLPELGLEAGAQDLDSSVFGTALHSKRHVWWIHDEADRCLPLPTWTSRLVELTVMAWVKERQACPFREERLSAEAGAAFRRCLLRRRPFGEYGRASPSRNNRRIPRSSASAKCSPEAGTCKSRRPRAVDCCRIK